MTSPVGPLKFARAEAVFTPTGGDPQAPVVAAVYVYEPGSAKAAESRLVLLTGTEVPLDVLERTVVGPGTRVSVPGGDWMITRLAGGCSSCGGR